MGIKKLLFLHFFIAACLLAGSCDSSRIRIRAPRDGAVFNRCEEITFSGFAAEVPDGIMTGSALLWTSSIDGALRSGSSFTLQSLSEGSHTITLTATGKSGMPLTASVAITIEGTGAAQPFAGVAVDPYIVGARFYEDRNNNGQSDADEQESSATGDDGRFNFSQPVSQCSTIRMKEKGLHIGLPYMGELKARAAAFSDTTDNSTVHVLSPATTLLANGWTQGQLVNLLRLAGIPGITKANLYRDPMEGMGQLDLRKLADGSLALIRSTLTISVVLQIIDSIIKIDGALEGLPASGFDLTYNQLLEYDDFFKLFLQMGRILSKIISYEQISDTLKNIGLGTMDCIGDGLGIPPAVTADIFIKSGAAVGNFLIDKISKDITYAPSEYQLGQWGLELANSFFVIKSKDNPCILRLVDLGLLPAVADTETCRINPDTEKVECF